MIQAEILSDIKNLLAHAFSKNLNLGPRGSMAAEDRARNIGIPNQVATKRRRRQPNSVDSRVAHDSTSIATAATNARP